MLILKMILYPILGIVIVIATVVKFFFELFTMSPEKWLEEEKYAQQKRVYPYQSTHSWKKYYDRERDRNKDLEWRYQKQIQEQERQLSYYRSRLYR